MTSNNTRIRARLAVLSLFLVAAIYGWSVSLPGTADGCQYVSVVAPKSPSELESDGYPADLLDLQRTDDLLAAIPLARNEGLWRYPADETVLLILPDKVNHGRSNIYLYRSVDCSLQPGAKVGWMENSPKGDEYRIGLSHGIKHGRGAMMQAGSAKYNDRSDALIIDMPKVKVSLAPSVFLPSLWRSLRLGVRLKYDNPGDDVPAGFVRVRRVADIHADPRESRYL